MFFVNFYHFVINLFCHPFWMSKSHNIIVDQKIALAGYNLIVTSEINKTPEDIYEAYHGL